MVNMEITTNTGKSTGANSDDLHVRDETRSGSGLCVTGGSSLLTGCVLTDMYSWSLAI